MISYLLTHLYFAVGSSPQACKANHSFLNFPTWYQYLDSVKAGGNCIPQIRAIGDFWLIIAAVVEILLRIATLAAIAMVLYGGISYITSQGEPDKTSKAKDTIFNALIGLAIAVTASVIIAFVARQF